MASHAQCTPVTDQAQSPALVSTHRPTGLLQQQLTTPLHHHPQTRSSTPHSRRNRRRDLKRKRQYSGSQSPKSTPRPHNICRGLALHKGCHTPMRRPRHSSRALQRHQNRNTTSQTHTTTTAARARRAVCCRSTCPKQQADKQTATLTQAASSKRPS